MNCKEARSAAIEHARSASAPGDPHFEACTECSRFLEFQRVLHSSFATLAGETPTAPNLEAALLAEFDATSHPPARWFHRWLPVAAVAVSLAVIAIPIHRGPVLAPRIIEQPFVQIPYIAPLAPYERTSIVRMDVPMAALIAAGFDVHAPDAGVAVRADVLFGQDGRAHALRLITNSVSNSKLRE